LTLIVFAGVIFSSVTKLVGDFLSTATAITRSAIRKPS
jgi:hypothetical protein